MYWIWSVLLLIHLGTLNLSGSGLFASWGDGLVLCPSVLSQESGCALFAALCKEDLIYSQPMNQLTLNMSFLNLNPKKLFCLDLGMAGHWHYQLDSYQIKLQVYQPWIPSVLEVLGLGFNQALSGEEEDKEACIAQMFSPTLAWNSQVAAWRSSNQQDRRPALPPRHQRPRAGVGLWRSRLDYI